MTKRKLDNIKTSGFKTPKDYFSQVEEQILNDIHLKDKVSNSGFEVPDSYFESLEDTIFSKIKTESNTKVISLLSWRKLMYASAIAAAMVLMFNVYFNPSETVTFEDLQTVSIENYVEQEDFTSYELASLLTEDELNTGNFITTQLSEDSIENYLLDNATIEELITE